ncbi:MAG TPA: hypothetical protein PKY35_14560 [Candidatus Hydrogenedentes bacterium]|nr:hypothetical protein [Candidatus Hydrogenedentota bacterium]HOL78241.1 hypothetical protein [Candidatus Hydrogenedentota bacterium]HPO86381.1 hypothetical protein [Candidatus Hydrogenedentota bacterium]
MNRLTFRLNGFIAACLILGNACLIAAAEEGAPSDADRQQLQPLSTALDQETKALEILRRFDKIQRQLIEWDRDLADSLLRMGDVQAAQVKAQDAETRTRLLVEAYEIFLAKYPNNPKAINYYGEVLFDYAGEQEKGVAMWKRAEELDPNLSMPANNLAIYYCHSGEYELGFHYLDKALQLDPENPDYHFNAAQIFLTNRPQAMEHYKWDEKKLYEEAMRHSRLATELSPEDYSLAEDYAVNFLASINLPSVTVNWEEAADAWVRARPLARHPDKIFFTWLNEARACIRGKYYKRAEKCLKEALKIRPDNKLCLQLLDEVRTAQKTAK